MDFQNIAIGLSIVVSLGGILHYLLGLHLKPINEKMELFNEHGQLISKLFSRVNDVETEFRIHVAEHRGTHRND